MKWILPIVVLLDEFDSPLTRINPDLTFEFSPVLPNGKRRFVISAGGAKKAFPAVVRLANSAPGLPRRRIVKFRQRMM